MNALKTVVIEYLGEGVSADKYNSNSNSFNKSEYLSHLASFTTDEDYTNARWKLSYEIYIPEGVVLEMPDNVTLVADGGFFSGKGTIKARHTKIEAGFERIFSPELNIDATSIWDITISHPEWFGAHQEVRYWYSGLHIEKNRFENMIQYNNSKLIQKAIDLIHASTLFVDIAVNTTDIVYSGGRVVCKPYSTYGINETIYLPMGISFDGGNSNFIYNCTPGTYMFKVNMKKDSEDWEVSERGQMDTISNIRMINLNWGNFQNSYINNAYGIYSASQGCTFENIQSFHMYQTFKRYHTYIDNLTLKNININFGEKSGDDRYHIEISYIGDNLLIDNIAFTAGGTYQGKPGKCIFVNACTGGLIQRITNGTIEIKNTKGLILSGVHQESGNIIIENTQLEINGLCHFKTPKLPAIVIKVGDLWKQRTVSVKNSLILYDSVYYDENSNHVTGTFGRLNYDDELDVQLGWITGPVSIENVFRSPKRSYTEASSSFGIRVNNNAFMKNSAMNSIASIVNGSSDQSGETGNFDNIQGVMCNSQISYSIPEYGTVLREFFPATENKILEKDRFFTKGDYYYYACVLLDKERNIGYTFPDQEQRLVTVGNTPASDVVMSFYRHYYAGLTIRLFRKKYGADTLYYIDIPVATSNVDLVDSGIKTEYGDKWKTVTPILVLGTSDIMDSNNKLAFSKIIPPNLLPQECNSYQSLGENVIVKMPQAPNLTKGTWTKGDIVYISSENRQVIM